MTPDPILAATPLIRGLKRRFPHNPDVVFPGEARAILADLLSCVPEDQDVVIRRDGTVRGLERSEPFTTDFGVDVGYDDDPLYRLTDATYPEEDQ